jgi:hypothetical protein
MLSKSRASASSRHHLGGSSDPASARKRILPRTDTGRRTNLQVVEKSDPNQTPTPPAASVWVPRGDRHAIVEAFGFGVSIYKLSQRQRRPFKVIESVLRDRIDELEGRIRAMEGNRTVSVSPIRRAA